MGFQSSAASFLIPHWLQYRIHLIKAEILLQ
jgi:hypothetical protein